MVIASFPLIFGTEPGVDPQDDDDEEIDINAPGWAGWPGGSYLWSSNQMVDVGGFQEGINTPRFATVYYIVTLGSTRDHPVDWQVTAMIPTVLRHQNREDAGEIGYVPANPIPGPPDGSPINHRRGFELGLNWNSAGAARPPAFASGPWSAS